ncbi:hypothetical protein JCM10207_001405 [Rhodosporidiobolus poonsookiae]
MSAADKTPAAETPALPTATLDKYKAAATVVSGVLAKLVEKAAEGANVLELCKEGDKLVEEGVKPLYNKAKGTAKGIAFPTTVSVNNVLQNFSPVPSDKEGSEQTLKKDDVVKIVVGAHIDGYPVVSGETVVVGASTVTGVRANLLQAAYQAGEIALRAVKPGVRNWEVTDAVKSLLKEYEASGVKGVEGILSHQFTQNNLEAKKGLIAFPNSNQRSDSDNAYTFEEGEVYGLNIHVTDGDRTPKTADTARTTIFSKTTSTYMLKMKTSRATFSEITQKAGAFPFTLRIMDDEVRARMGTKECVQHSLLRGYDLATTDKPENLSAQVYITFAVTKTGVARLSLAPTFYSADKVQGDVQVSDAVKETLARPLKPKAVKKKKADGAKEASA